MFRDRVKESFSAATVKSAGTAKGCSSPLIKLVSDKRGT